jgi:hypothetical protein
LKIGLLQAANIIVERCQKYTDIGAYFSISGVLVSSLAVN